MKLLQRGLSDLDNKDLVTCLFFPDSNRPVLLCFSNSGFVSPLSHKMLENGNMTDSDVSPFSIWCVKPNYSAVSHSDKKCVSPRPLSASVEVCALVKFDVKQENSEDTLSLTLTN